MDRRRFIGCSVAAAVATSLPFGRAWATKITGDVAAIRSGGGAATLAASDLQQLKDNLRGLLLLSGDPGYDVARRVRNQSIDKHPALIIQPSGAADVSTAVNFAREKDLLLAVKCGGHSYAGKSTCEGGMQIDLSSMRGVRVDTAARKAWVVGGSLLGALFGGGRRRASASKVSTAARSVGRASKERSDVAHAEADARAVRGQIEALNPELEAEVARIESESDASTIGLDKVSVKPRKADITVEDLALVWSA